MAIARSNKLHIQMSGEQLHRFFVGQINTVITGGKGQQAIQRARVQQIPAQLFSQQTGNCAFARTARPVDSNNRCDDHALSSSATRMPT